ncbi:MAG: biotin/lipoyl-binding protein, partial [Terracidiphilus sp.]
MSQTMLSEKEGQIVTPTQDKVQDKVPTPPVARRTGSRTKLVIALVVLMAVAVAVYALYMHFRDRVSTDDANVDGHISAISAKITGNVLEVAVLDNQQVKAGQVLVRIDPRDYQAAVDVAKATLAQAEGQL